MSVKRKVTVPDGSPRDTTPHDGRSGGVSKGRALEAHFTNESGTELERLQLQSRVWEPNKLRVQAFCKHRASAAMSPSSGRAREPWANPARSLHLSGPQRHALTDSRWLITRRSQVQILPPLLKGPGKRGLSLKTAEPQRASQRSGLRRRRARACAPVFLRSHEGIGVGSLEKVECLGSGADAKVAASVPDVCPDCVRGEYE